VLAMSTATAKLRAILEDGPVPAREATERMAGFSTHQIRTARNNLRVLASKVGYLEGAHWVWELPPRGVCPTCGQRLAEDAEDAKRRQAKAQFLGTLAESEPPSSGAPSTSSPVVANPPVEPSAPSRPRHKQSADCPRCGAHWALPPGSLCPARCGGFLQ
jgi:hypothetical protein